MKRATLILTFIAIILSVKSQEKIYLNYFSTENVYWEYQSSVTKIFKNFIINEGKYSVIIPEKTDSIYPDEPFEITKQKAQVAEAKYFIIGELNALNEVLIFSITMYNTSDGTKVWSDILKAKSPDDLDPILTKIAKTLGTENKSSQDGDIYNVTNYEAEQLKKVEATLNYGLTINGGYCYIEGVKNMFLSGFGGIVSYDLRDIIADIEGNIYLGDVDIYYISINGLYPFKYSKNTPFLGGGVSFSSICYEKEVKKNSLYEDYYYTSHISSKGLAFIVKGGYIFNRIGNTNLRLSGSLIIPTYEVGTRYPLGFGIGATILF